MKPYPDGQGPLPLSTEDLAWLIQAHRQFNGYVPFKGETITCLLELYALRTADHAAQDGDANA
jgi:hypothetical protein